MSTPMEVEKKESKLPAGVERTSPRRTFIPRVDIFETAHDIVVVADIPGVREDALDITVEKNVLSIHGAVTDPAPGGVRPSHSEYEVGDYQRVFTLPNEIDQSRIRADVKNGVLRLTLPRAEKTKPRKIAVQAA